MSVATATELWRLSATELAEAIRSRQISSHEVIQAHLRRIEAVNPSINAVTVVLGEQALEAAKAADRAVADGDPLPPFHGVPFTVKGNIDLVGTPTTHGAKALVGAFPTLDAPVVERLKAAGAIPIGRTNLPTFALRWHTDSELYGPTINPWDRSRTAGASQRWRGRGPGHRHEPAGPGQRWARVAAPPRPVLRNQRAEADPGSHPGRDHHRAGGLADRRPAGGRPGSAGPPGGRPASRPGGAGRIHLARPMVGAGTTARPRTHQAPPGGARRRPGGSGHRHPGPGRGSQGSQGRPPPGRRGRCRLAARGSAGRRRWRAWRCASRRTGPNAARRDRWGSPGPAPACWPRGR
jgi:Amidase